MGHDDDDLFPGKPRQGSAYPLDGEAEIVGEILPAHRHGAVTEDARLFGRIAFED
jgi:hypothetical protein